MDAKVDPIMDNNPHQMSWAELKDFINAISIQMQETDRRMQETDRRMEESRKKTDRLMEQSVLERKENHAKLDDLMTFVKQNIRESQDNIRKLENLFSTQWGKLIESLSQPAALQLFKDSDIHIDHIYEGCHKAVYDEHMIEVDVILCNKTEVVVVEVKTTCTNEHVQHFISQMEHFKDAFAEFRDKRVYLAMAAIKYNEHSDKYALKKGLFVLRTSGNGVFALDKPKTPITR